ncbi:MAG: peptidoglycan-associated lipoprotein Pal [Usitatibacteraceae bacterium]
MKKALIGIGMMVLLAACASKDPTPTKVEDRSPVTNSSTTTPPSTTGVSKTDVSGTSGLNPLKDPNNILSKRVIYFDYNTDAVRPEFASVIQAHASFLAQNRNRKVRLEGHADERGSREYNMALGQRRANAVRQASAILGVANDRMETISFGEDKPRANGHDEASWAQNRRVEIVYDGE